MPVSCNQHAMFLSPCWQNPYTVDTTLGSESSDSAIGYRTPMLRSQDAASAPSPRSLLLLYGMHMYELISGHGFGHPPRPRPPASD